MITVPLNQTLNFKKFYEILRNLNILLIKVWQVWIYSYIKATSTFIMIVTLSLANRPSVLCISHVLYLSVSAVLHVSVSPSIPTLLLAPLIKQYQRFYFLLSPTFFHSSFHLPLRITISTTVLSVSSSPPLIFPSSSHGVALGIINTLTTLWSNQSRSRVFPQSL